MPPVIEKKRLQEAFLCPENIQCKNGRCRKKVPNSGIRYCQELCAKMFAVSG